MATPYSGNVPPLAQPAQQDAAGPIIRTIGLSDLHDALATRLGRFQGGSEPRHHSVRDLSSARSCAGARRARLFGLAAAVPAGCRLCPARPVCRAWSLRTQPPPRTRRTSPRPGTPSTCSRSPSFGAMLGLGMLLLALFVTWIATAQAIYVAAFGYEAAAEIPGLRAARADHAAGLVADRGRLRRRLPVRAGRALHQRGVFPADARSSRQRGEAMVTSLRVVARESRCRWRPGA